VGKIVDAQTKQILIGANVVESGTQNGSITNENGMFSLKAINSKGKLEISFVGYQTKTIEFSSAVSNLGEISLLSEAILSNDIIVRAQRVDETTPMAFKTVTLEEIQALNVGQDLPYLLQMTPSILSSSDAGAGVGYTYMSIRGVDQARINVTINGIPINDAESHGVWWVNMPDLGSSVESIQIQRGVGTSTNGAASFGASINVETTALKAEPFAEFASSYGSFNTLKTSTQFGTGLLQNGWAFDARLSQINSDGYIDRASSDLQSYFLNASYHGKDELLKINVFSGEEKTYQAWYGTPEALVFGNQQDVEDYISRNGWSLRQIDINNLRNSDRRYNFYLYDNETDNYRQDHYQLHYSRKFTENWNANVSLHYTKGRGFFETYVVDGDFATYNLQPVNVDGNVIASSDLIRREWLDNDFYGFTFGSEWTPTQNTQIRIGGAANNYEGDHFGEVIWAQYAGNSPIRNRYYDNVGKKSDVSVFAKASQTYGSLIAYADVQVRRINYQFEGYDRLPTNQIATLDLEDPLLFINPKAGLTWNITDKQRAFASFSIGNKEATRNEYVNSVFQSRPQHETLYDWETGYQIGFEKGQLGINLYWMQYANQLLETGAINDVGEYVRQNVDDSYRAGIELTGLWNPTRALSWTASATWSQNRVASFTQFVDNYDLPYTAEGNPQQNAIQHTNTPLANTPAFLANSSLKWSDFGFQVEWLSRYVSLQYLDNTGSKTKSIPAFWVNDLRFAYRFTAFGKTNIEFNLLLNNVFNELYASRGYTFSYISGGETITENFYYPQAERHFWAQLRFMF
jgi:iron complex outermembrane receptor protein